MKMIPVPMGPELIHEMMEAMRAGNYTNRSEFIRDAIVEKAVALGLDVPPSLARPPQRVVYPAPRSGEAALKEVSSAAGLTPGGSLAEIEAQAEALAHRRSLEARAPIVRIGPPSGGKRRPTSGVPPGKGGPP